MTPEADAMPMDGWWPDDDHSPVTQIFRMRGNNIAQIVNCGKTGWRAFSMVEINHNGTTGKPLGDVVSRAYAKVFCEEYAQHLYKQV
jgi:hypothetical protein